MATKKGANQGEAVAAPQRAKLENPIRTVLHRSADLQSYGGGGGGSGTLLVPVDADFRTALGLTLERTRQSMNTELQSYPNLLGGMVLRLRDTGIAKTHRPVELIERCGLQPAGHAGIDEMLVGASTASLDQLALQIRTTSAPKVMANLSAILRLEPWGRARRNPEGTLSLRERGQALVRMFRFHDEGATQAARMSYEALMHDLNVVFKFVAVPKGTLLQICDLDKVNDEALDILLDHPALRSMMPDPIVTATVTGPALSIPAVANLSLGTPDISLPTVAIFDTGVSPGNVALSNWIASRNIFITPPDTDYVHGTALASLLVGAAQLNPGFAALPCLVHDVCGLESSTAKLSDIALRLEEAVRLRPDVKVWNLSFNQPVPCAEQQFGDLAQVVDRLSDVYGVLFVVSAGNYVDLPVRTWPVITDLPNDRVASPGDAVRALTVGSVAHAGAIDTFVQTGEPPPYTRRGPGPVFTPKPDVVHHGGNVHDGGDATHPWVTGSASTTVMAPNGSAYRGYGTSYAAPLAAALAAHIWNALEGQTTLAPNPALVKALLVHAAQLASPEYSPSERHYYGAGVPMDALNVLYDRDDSFTLVFEAQLLPGNKRWRKTPYPVPAALLRNGKLRAEVIITTSYAPPLDASCGAEYVRANVNGNFGVLDGDRFHGKVPAMGEPGTTGFEALQVEHGGKWSPTKTQRKIFPNGLSPGNGWALQVDMNQRAFEDPLAEPLKTYVVVTLRALDGNPEVHNDGIRALQTANWVSTSLPIRIPVQA